MSHYQEPAGDQVDRLFVTPTEDETEGHATQLR
jgi:hypothetical protein